MSSIRAYDVRRELWREFFVLRVLVFCTIIYLFLQVASMFRLFGVPGIPPLLLLAYRTLDVIVISSFFLICGARLKVRWVDLPLFLMIPYPILIGISRGNINMTFFNDITIFAFFVLKVLVIRTLILRFMEKTDFDQVFCIYARKIIRLSILAAILMLMVAYIAISAGLQFYYQAPADLTFAAALAMSKGHVPTYLLILVLAAIGGKRSIMIGVLIIGIFGTLMHKNIVKFLLTTLALVILAIAALVIFGGSGSLGDTAPMRRFISTWVAIETAWYYGTDWLEFLMFLDPSRFVEYISLKPYIEGWSYWFGNGLGFRYKIDSSFLEEFGRPAFEGSVTNAHFTPLAIVTKFGFVGLALWLVHVLGVIFSRRGSRSYFQEACRLGFISMLVQAIFSYSFFISFFTPIYVAGATLRHPRRAGVRVTGAGRSHLRKVR